MMFHGLTVATVAAAAATFSTTTVVEARVGLTTENAKTNSALFKSIRSLVGTHQKRIANNKNVGVEMHDRYLQGATIDDPTVLKCFYECINQQMKADECQEYIENLLGGPELPNHEVPNLTIKISPPRTVVQVSETYWMFGIPTNIYGEVDCNLNGGNIIYPWEWVVDGVGLAIPEIPCAGLDVNACCDKVHMTMIDENIPLIDDNGNCFSCWPHQEPLEPSIGSAGDVVYLEHSYSTATDTCEEMELSQFDVQSADAGAGTAIDAVVQGINDLLASDPALCADLEQLYRDMLIASRANTQAMSGITGLMCGFVCNEDGTFVITEELEETLLFIRLKLTTITIKSDENCIIIYTDRHDNVIEPPKIGGSREGLDIDLIDDCDEEGPGGNTGVECTGANEVESQDGTECVCAEGHVRVAMTGACATCQAPTRYENGECVCDGDYQEFEDGTCDCKAPTVLNPNTDKCEECVAPYSYDSVSRSCVCEAPFEEMDDGSCQCAAPLVDDGSGGCVPCEDNETYMDGQCICEKPFAEFDGSCQCAPPLVDDGRGGCVSCEDNETYMDGQCICEKPFAELEGSCQCAPPLVDDGEGGCIACQDSEVYKDGQCVCELPNQIHPITGICEPLDCYEPSPEPVSPILGTVYADDDYCEAPTRNDHTQVPEAYGNYKVSFKERIVNDLGDGKFTTTFYYEACTAQRDRSCYPKLEDHNNVVMSDVVVQIHGTCKVTGYEMFDEDGVSKGKDFPNQTQDPKANGGEQYTVGLDEQTCLNGFKWDIGWDKVSNKQCKEGLCRIINVSLDGIVPAREGLVAVQPGSYFVKYPTIVPDCDFECGDECLVENKPDAAPMKPEPLGINDGKECAPEYPRKKDDQTGKAGGDNYLVKFEDRIVKVQKSDKRTVTEFVYTACTAQPVKCGGNGPDKYDWWVSDIALEMCGECVVRRYDMYDANGENNGIDFPNQKNDPNEYHEEWFVGADIDTCLVGFKWDLDWKVVEKKGCSSSPSRDLGLPNKEFCRKISVTIDGNVPTTMGWAAVQPSFYMARYWVEVPNCCNVCPTKPSH